jgi:hypothetical protein
MRPVGKSWPSPKANAIARERRRCGRLPWFRCNVCDHAFSGQLVLDEAPSDADAPRGICPICQEAGR